MLTGINVESTYVYLLAEAGNHSADTWQLFMEDRKEHGSRLKVSISDAGTGLNAGIPKAFPDVCVQPDIFHELRPLGAEVGRLKRRAEKLISDEDGLEKQVTVIFLAAIAHTSIFFFSIISPYNMEGKVN